MTTEENKIKKDIHSYLKEHENKELLRFITCGSVDDGKSTLIGRLLYDSKMIFEDQLESIKNDSKTTNSTSNDFDLSLLVDGLQAEREQGITIDVAYRYFSTKKRKFIIADTPGHEQYTRNMATGASTADLAIILIDSRYGVQTQTKRHTFIAKLLGIKHIIIAINKIDLLSYKEDVYLKIKHDYEIFLKDLKINSTLSFIPISALNGDNIVNKGENLLWYKGNTLMHTLENIEISKQNYENNFTMSVQYVNRANLDYRAFCGTISSGEINIGDKIRVLPSNRTSKVKEIVTFDGNLKQAFVKQSISIKLEDEIDISRGDVLIKDEEDLKIASSFNVNLIWMDEEPLKLNKEYYIKRASNTIPAHFDKFYYKTNINTLKKEKIDKLQMNEIAYLSLNLDKKIAYDIYEKNKTLGSFIIIDKFTNNTVGAGMLIEKNENENNYNKYSQFELDFNELIVKHFPHWQSLQLKKDKL